MHDLLSASLMFDDILQGIEQVNQYLVGLHNRSQGSDDEFDRAVGAITGVMVNALDKRLSNPTYFIRHILTDFSSPDFLADFHIPLYLHNEAEEYNRKFICNGCGVWVAAFSSISIIAHSLMSLAQSSMQFSHLVIFLKIKHATFQ